jgi:hypothetical protein
MNDQSIEQEIQAKGKTAPRITPADIEANIASEVYFTAPEGRHGHSHLNHGFEYVGELDPSLKMLTFCVIVLRNGTKIVGINYGAIDPNQHSAEIGRSEARKHAIEQIWPLMGYELRSKLAA